MPAALDSVVITSPLHQGTCIGDLFVTPTGGARMRLADALPTKLPALLTVAALPPPTVSIAGTRAIVCDAAGTLVFGAVVVGCGGQFTPVFCSGAAWLIG